MSLEKGGLPLSLGRGGRGGGQYIVSLAFGQIEGEIEYFTLNVSI